MKTQPPGLFEMFYNSSAQHPWLLWFAIVFGLVWVLRKPPLTRSTRVYCTFWACVAFADAWLTSNHVIGIGVLSGSAASLVPLAFVLVGDLRFFLFAETAQADGTVRFSPVACARAVGFTLIVPALSQIVVAVLGADGGRTLFLVYETLFVALVFLLQRYFARCDAPKWALQVSHFVILYYGLWASADAIVMLAGSDLGFAVRVVSNVLYYGGLIPAIAWAQPVNRR